jgi:surface antigen
MEFGRGAISVLRILIGLAQFERSSNMKVTGYAAIAALVLALAGCQDRTMGTKQGLGTIAGAALGGLAGSQIGSGKGQLAAIGAGVLLGAFLGSEIGKSLDRADRAAMYRTTQTTLERQPSGTTATWQNPDSGNYGTFTPKPAYQTTSGQYCREFQQSITVGGQTQDAYGTACRQPDGTWKIVSNQ